LLSPQARILTAGIIIPNAEAYLASSGGVAHAPPAPRSTRPFRQPARRGEPLVRSACPANVLSRADRMGQSGRPRPRGRAAGALARPDTGQDLGHAGHAAPASFG